MSAGAVVGLAVAFAAGVLVAQSAADFQREATPCRVPQGSAAIDPAPASLLMPLCEHGWVASCSDRRACRYACLTFSVYDPGAPSVKPKGNLKDLGKGASKLPLVLRASKEQ